MYKKVLVLIVLLLNFGICFSQEPLGEEIEEDEIMLEQIVVTPYKTYVSAGINPASISIIDVSDQNSEGVFDIANSIENIPSLSYKSSGAFSVDSSVFIRGANSYHTQVMLDDIKLYDPMHVTGNFSAYNVMSLDNLDKIEVLKGPYSSLYGSSGIGGTISLLTRKGEGRPTVSYTQEIGSYQTYREILSSQGKIDKFAYSLSVSRLDVRDSYAGKYKDANHETDPYENFSSSLRLDYDINDDLSVGLLTDYTYAKYEQDGWGGADANGNYTQFYQGIGGIKLKQVFSDLFYHKINLAYTRTYRKGWEASSGDFWYNGKTYQIRWQGDYQPFDFNKIIFGFDYLRDKGSDFAWATRDPKRSATSKGYYIENIFTPFDNLFFAASFRNEHHSRFKHHNVFSLSGSYLIEATNTKLKASFGEGFRAPSLYESYSGLYGNINLNPEESENYEVGFEQKIWNKINFGATYFHTHFSNLIESDPVTWKQINAGKARIYGVENFIEYCFNDDVKLSVEYTHLDTKKKSDGSRLTYRPNNKLTTKLKAKFNKLEVYADLSYVGNRRVSATTKLKSYLLGNIAFNYQLNDKVTTFLRVENVLDYDYETANGYQTPKLSGYLGAKVTF